MKIGKDFSIFFMYSCTQYFDKPSRDFINKEKG